VCSLCVCGLCGLYDYINWVNLQASSSLGEYDKALTYLDKIREFPDNEIFIQILIPTLDKINADKKSIELIDHALSTYITHSGQTHTLGYYKAKAIWKLEKYQEAMTYSNNAPTGHRFIQTSLTGDYRASNFLTNGVFALYAGDRERAESSFNLSLQTRYDAPMGYETWYLPEQEFIKGAVRLFFDLGEYQEAVFYIEKLSDENLQKRYMETVEHDKILQGSLDNEIFSEKSNSQTPEIDSQMNSEGGGCLIATATYGSELAPQVQQLRELRDHKLLQTESGSAFMESINDFYYSFSPAIADYERENPVFREVVKIAITPMISSLSLLNHVDIDSESEVLGYGISLIVLNVGMYVGIPAAIVVWRFKK